MEKGSELTVTVRVADAPAGSKVCLRAFGDWAVTPEEQEVPAGKAVSDLTFRVRLPKESPLYLPEYPCPLLAELRNADGKRIGVCNAVCNRRVTHLPPAARAGFPRLPKPTFTPGRHVAGIRYVFEFFQRKNCKTGGSIYQLIGSIRQYFGRNCGMVSGITEIHFYFR